MRQVRPKKNLGQHFLVDQTIARRIADTVDQPFAELPVLEVGPGMGVMTQYLMQKPRPLKVVEIDRESVAYLKGTLFRDCATAAGDEPAGGRTGEGDGPADGRTGEGDKPGDGRIIEGDFLRMDLHDVFGGQPFVLTGNYPYDISSQIFFKMLDNRDLIPCCTGMIQHEVALRMAAAPGNKQYGILSVLMQAYYDVEYLFTVGPDVFNPPPKVRSAVIRLTRNATPRLDCDEQLFRRVVKAVFNQRRKMLRVSLRQLLPADVSAGAAGSVSADTESPVPAGAASPIELTRRPEQLSVNEFVELTNWVARQL